MLLNKSIRIEEPRFSPLVRKRTPIIADIEGDFKDAMSFYRGFYPLSVLETQGKIVHIPIYNLECSWPDLIKCDIVFIQRPYNQNHLDVIKQALNLDKLVWVDFDDNAFDIPSTNPASKYPLDMDVLGEIVKLATKVTVATDNLKDVYLEYNKNTSAIPNCLNDYEFLIEDKPAFNMNKNIVWRGGGSHEFDLHLFWNEILKTMKECNWEFNFMGAEFIWQTNDLPNYTHYGIQEIISFYHSLIRLNPCLCIIPLERNALNIGKTNCNWIEATYSGAACLVPDFGDFRTVSGIHYNSENFTIEDFGEELRNCIKGKYDLKKYHDNSWEEVRGQRLLSEWNKERIKIIDYLMEL